MKKYDIAAYIWPSYTGDELRAYQFWEKGFGEWQTVMAHKSVIKGDKWPRKPLWGYVNEANPDVMAMEIDVATRYGVNVFIYDWYWYDKRPFLEQCLNDGFLKAHNNKKMKFYLMWANHDAMLLWDKRNSRLRWNEEATVWSGKQDFAEFRVIVDRLIHKYFLLDNYYKIDDCPVFMLYDLHNFIQGFGGLEQAKKAIEYLREEVKKAGFKDLHLQTSVNDRSSSHTDPRYSDARQQFKAYMEYLGFNSFTNYQMIEFESKEMENLSPTSYSERVKCLPKELERIEKEKYSIPYFPNVSVGWDSNPRFNEVAQNILLDCTPEAVEVAFRTAKAYVDKHKELPAPLLTVNSWNEWTETSYLQPDNVYGYGYLETIKKVFLDEKDE